jgi:hypothetical protein
VAVSSKRRAAWLAPPRRFVGRRTCCRLRSLRAAVENKLPAGLSISGSKRHNDWCARAGSRLRNFPARLTVAREDRLGAMTGSSEFTTWTALAGAAIVAGLTAIYSSSPWVLIAAALIGAYVGYKGEQVGRRYLQQYLAHKRSQ